MEGSSPPGVANNMGLVMKKYLRNTNNLLGVIYRFLTGDTPDKHPYAIREKDGTLYVLREDGTIDICEG